MKTPNTMASATTSTLIAAALCTALLAGCGSPAQSDAPSAAAGNSTSVIQTEVNAGNESNAYDDSVFFTSASDYADISSFSAQTIDGKTFTQDDLARADVTHINFWSPDCGYCVEEMPQIASWHKTMPQNVQLITVCTDYELDPVSAQEIIEECGFEGVTLVSGEGDFVDLVNSVAFLPTTIAVDSSGNVVGDALEGMTDDVPATFGRMVDVALQAQGKAATNA